MVCKTPFKPFNRYPLRNGSHAYLTIYTPDATLLYTWSGVVIEGTDKPYPERWTDEGRAVEGEENPYDIISTIPVKGPTP